MLRGQGCRVNHCYLAESILARPLETIKVRP